LWDSYVEAELWAISVRMLWRVAEAAKHLGEPALNEAVAEFEAVVNVDDLKHLRDQFEHADEYAVGLGRRPLRHMSVDIDQWSAAAQELRIRLLRTLRPLLAAAKQTIQ
jgi:hydroxypyruvate isomerase